MMFEKIKYYYEHGLWSIQRVFNVVDKDNGITKAEYKEITGFKYPAMDDGD